VWFGSCNGMTTLGANSTPDVTWSELSTDNQSSCSVFKGPPLQTVCITMLSLGPPLNCLLNIPAGLWDSLDVTFHTIRLLELSIVCVFIADRNKKLVSVTLFSVLCF